ncbi:MAG TPA: FkbM family methyltransferase [Sandaracinaceae bacterium LLY-WYZ-13_1]|nr:FkbM family methyltransferase [Sandaracinaceae bacterium LLY-WYZ-13_1]
MTNLIWRDVAPYGPVGVPGRSRWALGELMGEVSEYFACGARVERGDVVFDVGANVGAFAIAAAHRCEGALELHCFEPVPAIHGALRANTRRNPRLRPATTRLYRTAVVANDDDGPVELSYFRRFPTDSTCDLASKRRDFELFFAHQGARVGRALEPAVGRRAARRARRLVAAVPRGELGRWLVDTAMGRESMRCPTTTLSSVVHERGVRRIDLLKVDVEGAELDVLLGLCERHWRRIEQVVLEGHDHDGRLREITGLLRARGFQTPRVARPGGAEERGLNSFLLYACKA